jgi:hypothetical protein
VISSRGGRNVAQSGSALAWGARGPEFKSRRSDQSLTNVPETGCVRVCVRFKNAQGEAIPGGAFFVAAEGSMQSMERGICIGVLTLIAACAGVTHVVSTGPDTFMVASHGTMGWSSGPAQKAKAFEEAGSYCKGLGKEFQPIKSDETASGFGKIASGEVEFRCVKSANP